MTSDNFALLDNFATPLFVLDARDAEAPVYAAFNAWARRIATRPLSDYIGRDAREVYPSGHGQTAFRHHQEAARSGQTITYEVDLPIDGRIRSIRTTLTPRRDAGGKVRHLFGFSQDITELREAHERQAEFDALTFELENFVSIAARDLRMPMRHVAALADLLRENFVDHGDGKIALINMITDVAGKSMSLISDVLAHASARPPDGRASQFCFGTLCQDIYDVLDPQNRHVVIYSDGVVEADRPTLQVVLRNILDLTFLRSGGRRLRIDIVAKPGREGMLDLWLDDNGFGFDFAAMELFTDPSVVEQCDDRGGLCGVARLIQTRGGTIRTTTGRAQGATVISISLPGKITGPRSAPRLPEPVGQPALQYLRDR